MSFREEAAYIAKYLRLGNIVSFQLLCMLALGGSTCDSIEEQIREAAKRA